MANKIGEMAWLDLTVEDASNIKDFYRDVIGWNVEETSMGDYHDFTMNTPETKTAISGICHAKGENAHIPPSWLPYFLVADIHHSVEQVLLAGGELLGEIKTMGSDKYAIFKDPAGAVCAIYQQG